MTRGPRLERKRKALLALSIYRSGDCTYRSLAETLRISRPYVSKLLRLGRDLERMHGEPR